MKLTVTGVSNNIINCKDKRDNTIYQAIIISGTFKSSQTKGLDTAREFVRLEQLGGVIPNIGDVLLIDKVNNFIDSIEWLSHASANMPHEANNYSAKPEDKTNGNGAK